jgi:hypothetical protein
MVVFREVLTDGFKVADDAEIADLESYARALFDKTCEAVRARTKMPAHEREAFEAEVAHFTNSFVEIGQFGEKRLRLAAMRAAAAALALGFYHAGNGEVVRGLRSQQGREGGEKSGAVRKANRRWKPHAKELALEACKRDPSLANGKVASEVEGRWKLAEAVCPTHRALEGFVSELRKSGELTQRSGSLRKRSGSLRK